MNWGGFAGGFAQGLNQTFDVKGLTRYMMSPEYRQQKVLADAAAEARAAEVKAPDAPSVVDNAKTTGISGQPENAPEPVKVEVPPVAASTTTPVPENPESTVTPGSGARAIAESSAPPVAGKAASVAEPATPPTQATMAQSAGVAGAQPKQAQPAQKTPAQVEDFLYSKVLPNAKNKLIEMGDLEGAAKLEAQMESAKGKQAMAVYGKAYNALTYGNDVNKAVQLFGEYYNKFVDDGVDFTKGEVTKDGQIVITTKNKADGKENQMTLSRGQLLRMGMAYNPVKLYEMNLAEAVDAEKQAAKTRGEIAKEDRKFNQDIEKMTIEKQLDAANASAKTKAEVSSKVAALRESGYSNEFINGVMPEILGVGKYKKDASPEEARRILHGWRMDRDTMYARKTPEQQREIISKDMENIYGPAKKSDAQPTPAQPTKPAAGLPSPVSGKGMPVWDTKLGKMVYQ